MLTGDHSKLDPESEILGRLFKARQDLKDRLDEMTSDINHAIQVSDDSTKQLQALHLDYERVQAKLPAASVVSDEEIRRLGRELKRISDEHERNRPKTFGDFIFFFVGSPTGEQVHGGMSAYHDKKAEEQLKAQAQKRESIIRNELVPIQDRLNAATKVLHSKEQQKELAELKKLYHGVVAEILLDNGIHIARQLNQYAHFNGTDIDSLIWPSDNYQFSEALNRLVRGCPSLADIDFLRSIDNSPLHENPKTPEARALKQFVNHVLIPNKTYFDLLASFSDDIRDQDLDAFPPLEILGQKPITFSGRISHESEAQTIDHMIKQEEEFLDRAKAKVAIREQIAGGVVYEIVKDNKLPHVKKMENLVAANEAEIERYADIFTGIEKAVEAIEERRLELADQSNSKTFEVHAAEKSNAGLDARINEIRFRNDAKQRASIKASRVRGSLAMGGGLVLALLDGGTISGGIIAQGAHQTFRDKSLSILKRGAKDSLHSVTYAVGQEVMTSTENAALDDYMYSLQLQKADLPALRNELDNLQQEIAKVQKDSGFQAILRDEGKRSMVAETLLLRSLIRNGYNNSLEIEELCNDENISSIDDFLSHYDGTRLGLALKKHCHGIADSNDISVILAEANSLRTNSNGYDLVLKNYVEDVMKPNIAAFYSKASKMDVITHSNLTGFGNELHFSSEMQMETNRAVRVLLANEFGASVVGKEDVRAVFDFWLHRHGDRRLYDEKIRDGEMSDEYPDKRVSHITTEKMDRFVDMAKRSVASGRQSFPKIGDMFMRVCAYEYFLPQAIHVGGKENIFTNYPESPSAYPMVNTIVGEFIQKMSFAGIDDYREKIGERLDNIIAQSFIDFFARIGIEHEHDLKLIQMRDNLKVAANYDDYAPLFDRYTKNITRDAVQRFDLFLDIYKGNLEKQIECATDKDRSTLEEQVEHVKDYADGRLNPAITQPGTYEARMRAYDESHAGENTLRL